MKNWNVYRAEHQDEGCFAQENLYGVVRARDVNRALVAARHGNFTKLYDTFVKRRPTVHTRYLVVPQEG